VGVGVEDPISVSRHGGVLQSFEVERDVSRSMRARIDPKRRGVKRSPSLTPPAAEATLAGVARVFIRDWGALQQSPFFPMWASAAVDEMISALHERLVVGPRSAS